jgi:adenylate cyclase
MLASFAFPRAFRWVVLVELSEVDAYLAVDKMIRSLGFWVGVGMLIAIAGAILFALGLSRPILAIGQAAIAVSKGDFRTRVTGVRTRDEIGDLAGRMNEMIVQLNERFELQKFVSVGTMAAVQKADHRGVRLGCERRRVAMLFCDIRGYTAFSERTDPEQVVEILNFYLQRQADLVAEHGGDIDKFVGDEIVAVFQGEAMVRDAIACALDIQAATRDLNVERPQAALSVGIGINVGDVVMGAMGSRQRMDFTVLGDNVNLTARLCDRANPGQILVSRSAYDDAAGDEAFQFERLPPMAVKGKAEPLTVYQVERAGSAAAV